MSAGHNRLVSLTNELRGAWEETKHDWSDAKSREFEQRFLTELVSAVNQAINNIESLERVIAKIHTDCE